MLQERVSDHRHQCVSMEALPSHPREMMQAVITIRRETFRHRLDTLSVATCGLRAKRRSRRRALASKPPWMVSSWPGCHKSLQPTTYLTEGLSNACLNGARNTRYITCFIPAENRNRRRSRLSWMPCDFAYESSMIEIRLLDTAARLDKNPRIRSKNALRPRIHGRRKHGA